MKTQEELKQQIVKEMEELGYKLIPPLNFEVLDISEYTYEKRIAYYQNISKIALDIEFEKAIEEILKDKI
jgi:ribose 5-phosphate isomerase RpiB